MARVRNTKRYKISLNQTVNIQVHKDLKKTLEKLQRFYQAKENKNKKPQRVTLTWTSKQLNNVIQKMLREEIKR